MLMRIEVICTGDEVLTGKIVNSNFSYISQKLEDFGLSLTWETTVGDDRDELLLAFQLAGQRADAVIVNGGLGPTVDDLSQEIAAKAAGVGLELNEAWMATMEAFFAKRLRQMPPNNKKQAMLPVGAAMVMGGLFKSIAAKGGLMERAERMILLGIALLHHSIFEPVLWVLLVLTTLTALGRFRRVWSAASALSQG